MDLLGACSAPFKALGKKKLGLDEFRRFLVFRLGWFSPGEVDKLVDLAVNHKLLGREGDTLVYLGVDGEEARVGDKHDKGVEGDSKLFEVIVGLIMEHTGLSREEVLDEVDRKHRKHRELIPEKEFAATLVAWEKGVNVSHLHREVLEKLKTGRAKPSD